MKNTLTCLSLKNFTAFQDEQVTFMLTYGDGIADVDINALLNSHKRYGKMATLTGINPASRFGELKITGEKVDVIREKPKDDDGLINGWLFPQHVFFV